MQTKVIALYVHGPRGVRRDHTEPIAMMPMTRVDAIAGCGIQQDKRFFRSVNEGRVRKRQVSLIDEGTLLRLERLYGPFGQELVKSQIVLEGDIFLPDMIGSTLIFSGGAELTISIPRAPCFAMDLVRPGLQNAMGGGQQGALALVSRTGTIFEGQSVRSSTAASIGVTEAVVR